MSGPSPLALFTAEADTVARERLEVKVFYQNPLDMIAVICVLIIHDFHRHQLCDQGGERAEDTMQPGRTATFLRSAGSSMTMMHDDHHIPKISLDHV